MKASKLTSPNRWLAVVYFLLLLLSYNFIFRQYFPNHNGTLGEDYSRILPDLLDGYYWYRSNGISAPFWFTPSFCGGQPQMADLASVYYSLPQFLTFVISPLDSIYVTVLLFASLGFLGFYLLLRSCFGLSRQAAILGGALFMFNGYFIHRMLVGHIVYHAVMLVPAIAFFLLRPNIKNKFAFTLLNSTVVACLVAYCAYSGLLSLLTPVLVAILAIVCVHGVAGHNPSDFILRASLSSLLATGLSATKLVATIAFMSNFPRSDYALPGITNPWNAIRLLFEAIFLSPPDIAKLAQPLMSGTRWLLAQHEWEYGITVVPLLIVVAGSFIMIGKRQVINPKLSPTRRVWLLLLGFILALPLAINIYTPEWNSFLKQVPVIKSSSNLLRWFLIYISVAILFASLIFDRISVSERRRNTMLFVAIAALVLINAIRDRTYYKDQSYWPGTILGAWAKTHDGVVQPRIEYISAIVNANNQVQVVPGGNDKIAEGASQLACYNAVFGYRLEHFPVKVLHPGPVMDEKNGWLNVKNPACYLYPEQNDCEPGDHFTVSQREAALSFADYKPFPFKVSRIQQLANQTTLISLALALILALVGLTRKIASAINTR
ncbi:MAG: hypothetical protein WA632_12980 [Gallionella sp.]